MSGKRAKAIMGPVLLVIFFTLTVMFVNKVVSVAFFLCTLGAFFPATIWPLEYQSEKRHIQTAKYKATVVRAICAHEDAEPVKVQPGDEIVSWVCPRCDGILSPDWTPPRAQIEQADDLIAQGEIVLENLVQQSEPRIPEGYWSCGRCQSVIPVGYWHQCEEGRTHTAPYGG